MARMICDHAGECDYIDCVAIRPHRCHKSCCNTLICPFIDKPVACITVVKGGKYNDRKRNEGTTETIEDSF